MTSVVITVYGAGRHLERVVEALKRQSPPVEHIIISHSGTGDPTARFTGVPGISVKHSPKRLFAGAARNRGLALAKSEWVSFLDEDIIVDEHWHSALLTCISKEPAPCIIGAIDCDAPGGYWGLSHWIVEFSTHHSYTPGRYIHAGASATMTVRRKLLTGIGGFPEDLPVSEDTMIQSMFRDAGHKIWFEPTVIGRHVMIPGLKYMLRHNYELGSWSARLRLSRPDLPGAVAARQPLVSLGVGLVRAALIYRRVLRHGGPVLQYLICLPGVLAGLLAYNVGFSKVAFASAFALAVGPKRATHKIVPDKQDHSQL